MRRLLEQSLGLAIGHFTQGFRSRADELLAVERRAQAHHPQTTGQFGHVAPHGGSQLALDQIARHRPTGVSLGHHQTEPMLASIHKLHRCGHLACG